jgi:hypothetical protein
VGPFIGAGWVHSSSAVANYPYFKDQTLHSIQNVQLLHGYHLYWPELDVDLEIDNLSNPEKYPLQSRIATGPTNKNIMRAVAHR